MLLLPKNDFNKIDSSFAFNLKLCSKYTIFDKYKEHMKVAQWDFWHLEMNWNSFEYFAYIY